MTYYAFRDSQSGEFLSILARVDVDTNDGSPVFQTISPLIRVGSFGRASVFVTTKYENAVSLYLLGHATDFREEIEISCFEDDEKARNFEIVDFPTGKPISVDWAHDDLYYVKDRYRELNESLRRACVPVPD